MSRMHNKSRDLTPLMELVQLAFGEDLGRWMKRQRTSGQSWEDMARTITERAKRSVTGETVRAWYRRLYPPVPAKDE